jgi:cold shock CspA family protein
VSAQRDIADTGRVSQFDAEAGLGTITTTDGNQLPFHCAEIADGTRTIEVGANVRFDVLRKLGRDEAARIELE